MTFEKASNLLSASFEKYGLTEQVSGALVCEKSRRVFVDNFAAMVGYWSPQKFVEQTLYIAVENASARSKLFLETQNILELFKEDAVLKLVKYIKIVRPKLDEREF